MVMYIYIYNYVFVYTLIMLIAPDTSHLEMSTLDNSAQKHPAVHVETRFVFASTDKPPILITSGTSPNPLWSSVWTVTDILQRRI